MGTESDRMVYDYLSRVGDLAQQALPSAERMHLVTRLREDIDRQRSGDRDSPAAVRRILGRMGSPDAVVERAAGMPSRAPSGSSAPGGGDGGSRGPDGTRGAERAGGPDGSRTRDGSRRPGGPARGAGEAGGRAEPVSLPSPRDPESAGGRGTGGEAPGRRREPDWWRTGPAKRDDEGRVPAQDRGRAAPADRGGIPGVFRFTPDEGYFEDADEADGEGRQGGGPDGGDDAGSGTPGNGDEADGDGAGRAAPREGRRRWWRRRAVRAPAAPPSRTGVRRLRAFGWRELAAVALLIGGTVAGQWIAVLGGWVLAYHTLRLNRTEARIAGAGIPGAALLGLFVWMWGRAGGRWGEKIAEGKTGDAFRDGLPVAVQAGALVSAVFVVWRADRRARR